MQQSFPVIEGAKALWYDARLRSHAHDWQPRLIDLYGPIFGLRLHRWLTVYCAGAEAARYCSLNPDGALSAAPGTTTLYGRLFENAMFFQDHEAHQHHRDAYKAHFKQEAMAHYAAKMQYVCALKLEKWPTLTYTRYYPLLREISLFMGCAAFFDRPAEEISALITAYQRFDQILKSPLLAFRGKQLIDAKKTIIELLQRWIETQSHSEFDLINQLKKDETIRAWSHDTRLAESLLSLLFAVHDTTSSSLATLIWQGANNVELQDRWRISARATTNTTLDLATLKNMHFIGASFNEALRWCSPTQGLVRRVVAPCTISGHVLPADTYVALTLHYNHHDHAYWKNPAAFQPERFLAPRDEHKKAPYQWLPFGGGPHKCIGLHMAELIAKIFIATLCRHFCFEYAGKHHQYPVRTAPTVYPSDGLPLRLAPLITTSPATATTTST